MQKNVDEIDGWGQFHQHFASRFHQMKSKENTGSKVGHMRTPKKIFKIGFHTHILIHSFQSY